MQRKRGNKQTLLPSEGLSRAGRLFDSKKKWGFFNAGILLLLAVGTTLLLHRGTVLEETRQSMSQGRSLARNLAQSVGPSVSFEDHSRLLRLLESTAQVGDLTAAVILDSDGMVIAHTDVSKSGTRVDHRLLHEVAGRDKAQLAGQLFGASSGHVFLHPVIGAQGRTGTVAILSPQRSYGLFSWDALKLLIPAGLLLLAFIGINQATVRWAIKPTSDFITQLSEAIESNKSAAEKVPPLVKSNDAMLETLSGVSALHELKDELMLRNRLLEFEKKRMQLVLNRFPDGLIMTNVVKKVVLINSAATRLLGLSDAGVEDPSSDEYSQLIQLHLAQVLRTPEGTGRLTVRSPMDSAEHQILVSQVPLTVLGDEPAGTLYILRDVTAQEAAQRAQAEFLGQITHELKAPLHTIVTYMDGLTEENLFSNSEERRDFLNTMSAETMRMNSLISNLLQLSRIQLGNLSARFSFVKPHQVIRHQTSSLSVQGTARGVTVDVNVPENLPALFGDKDLLGVAVNNLINNAIKYTPKGGSVLVRAQESEGGLLLDVEDTGIGITEEARARVFQRFYRSDQEEVQSQTGSGLGLFLVKEIVEIHGGRVSLHSELGKGSRFSLWFPSREVGTRIDVAAA
jgi:signal transduction histidine kinase